MGTHATTYLPLLSLSDPTLTEKPSESSSPIVLFNHGTFHPGVDAGIESVTHMIEPTHSLVIEHGSGTYEFVITGQEGVHVCAKADEVHFTFVLACVLYLG